MAGPWEKYAQQASPTTEAPPWVRYGGEAAAAQVAPRAVSRAEQQAALAGIDIAALGPDPNGQQVNTGFTVRDGNQYQAPMPDDPMRQPSRPRVGVAEAVLHGANQGATFGFGDELVARIMSADPRITYDDALAQVRDSLGAAREDRPVATFAGEMAGSMVPGAVAGRAAAGAQTVGGAMLRGAGAGAATGAVQGFGAGEGGAAERGKSAAVGLAIGGAIGGAIPALAHGVGAAARHVGDWRAGQRVVGEVAQDLGVSRQAARHIADAIGADDQAIMAANIRAAGPDAMLADAGPSVQGALDAAMQRPGAASRVGMRRIEDRAAKSMGRINQALDEALGAPTGAETTKGAIRQGTQGARAAAYDAAYSTPIDYSSGAGMALEGLLPRIPGKAIRDANLLMQLDGDTSRQIMASIADDGAVSFKTMPDDRQWDYIKRALDHAATSGEGQGALGGQTAMGRAYQGLSRSIRDGLRDAVPQYGTALETSADAIKRVQGVEAGYGLLRPSVTREGVRDALKGATGPERDAIKQGLRDYLDDTLANVRSVISDPNVDAREARAALGALTSRASRDKIGMLLGKDAPKLYMALDEAQKALGLRAAVAQNSKTAARLAHNARIAEQAEPGIIRSALSGRPIRAGQKVAETLSGSTPAATGNRADRVNAEFVRLLTSPGQNNALSALAAVNGAVARNALGPMAGKSAQSAVNAIGFGALPSAANAFAAMLMGR